MTYRIAGLPRSAFTRYFGRTAAELAELGAMRVVADADRGYPCRIGLRDADVGDSLVLLNFTSHDVANPYRTAYAIYACEDAREPEPFIDTLPPMFADRILSLRGFDAQGLLVTAQLAGADAVDGTIRAQFAEARVACIHAHNAAYGCFAAKIERHGHTLGEAA